jgi:hypothetical protein
MWRDIDECDSSVGQTLDDHDYTKCWRCGHKVGIGSICPICASVNKWETSLWHGVVDNAQGECSAEEDVSPCLHANDPYADAGWDRGGCVNEGKCQVPCKAQGEWARVHSDDDGGRWLHVVLTSGMPMGRNSKFDIPDLNVTNGGTVGQEWRSWKVSPIFATV